MNVFYIEILLALRPVVTYPKAVTKYSINMQVNDENTIKKHNKISIEFCTKCKWGLRAHWLSQELFSTFRNNEIQVKLTLK